MAVTIDGSAGVTTNAGGSVNPSTNIDGINYSCRAWVNFNGTGTVAIRASGNVTSITDNGLGDYTINFTTAMSDVNYCMTGGGYDDGTYRSVVVLSNSASPTVSAFRLETWTTAGGNFDFAYNYVSFFR
jgi:hypothetical protein